MAARMRLFIAIDVPEAVRDALVGAQHSLRERASARLRWTRPDAMHLTLKFLGDVDAARVPSLSRVVAGVAARHHPFGLSVSRLGAFPGGRRLQVVWAGIEGDLQALGALRDALESELAAEGYAAEARAFRPHVTLGRTRDGMRPDEAERISAALTTRRRCRTDWPSPSSASCCTAATSGQAVRAMRSWRRRSYREHEFLP